MLTREESEYLRRLVAEYEQNDGLRIEMMRAINRATDVHYPKNDVIAAGPDLSSATMLNDAARALGWRTDFACGDSPITWDLVLDEIRKLARAKPPDAVVACVGDKYKFEYEGKDAKHNALLTVVRVVGYKADDLVFFDDGSHSKQSALRAVQKVK